MKFLNFEEQLVHYGQYHHHPLNKLIHIICIPFILWTSLLWLFYLPSFYLFDLIGLSAPYVVVSIYIIYYLLLEPVAGILFTPIIFLLIFSAELVHNKFSFIASKISWIFHISAWIIQFLGHAFIEKRSPALFHSFFESILFAPLFVFLEVLFWFGYRPALQSRINGRISMEIEKWKSSLSQNKKQ